ncbi:MAG: ABC transporter substrate-binding protein, partial [Clostridia bacterium]|nr:ABC transporter substrate-binding protein [Clostridia bacterium]
AMSAAQPMDIAQTNSSRLVFTTWVNRGGFMGIKSLLEEHATGTYEVIPDWCWEAVTVDGEIYAIPSYKDVVTSMGFIYNYTLLNEFGMPNAVEDLNFCTARDLDALAYEVKELRDAAHPDWAKHALIGLRNNYQQYYQADQLASVAFTAIDGFFLEDEGLADGTKVFNLYDTVEHAEAMKLIKRWVDDGIYPYDAENYDPDGIMSQSGSRLGAFSFGTVAVERNQYENYEQILVQPRQTFATTTYVHGAMNGIAAHSTAPVEAIKCIDKMYTDSIYATTWRFGIQGTHWNPVEIDGKIRADFTGTKNADPSNRGFYSWYHAEMGNLFACYLPTFQDDQFYEKLDAMNSSACVSVNMGFLANVEKIENEIAACSGVVSEYDKQLKYGLVEVDPSLTAFNEKLYANGAQVIVDELQAQLDAWRASK